LFTDACGTGRRQIVGKFRQRVKKSHAYFKKSWHARMLDDFYRPKIWRTNGGKLGWSLIPEGGKKFSIFEMP
jgi:hypothetical protein